MLRPDALGAAACAANARLAAEQPAVTSAELSASRPVRAAAKALLAAGESRGGYALTALAGTGDTDDLTELAALAIERLRSNDDRACDDARLALRAMESIVARSQRGGRTAALGAGAVVSACREIVDTYAAESRREPDVRRDEIEYALRSLLTAVTFAWRASGVESPTDRMLAELVAPRDELYARACVRDLALREELLALPAFGPICGEVLSSKAAGYGAFAALAHLVNHYDDASVSERVRSATATLAFGAGRDPIKAEAAFTSTLADLSREHVGVRAALVLDPQTHLVAQFLTEHAPRLLVLASVPVDARVVGRWDFAQGQAWAAEMAIHITAAEMLPDQEPGESYLCLRVPRVSRVDLAFHCPIVAMPALTLQVRAQANLRAVLPHGGVGYLDVLFDGELLYRDLPLLGAKVETLRLQLAPHDAARRRVLTLRASAESTTPLRVYEVVVGY